MARSSSKSRLRRTPGKSKDRGAPVLAIVLVLFFAAATPAVLYLSRSEDARVWFESNLRREGSADPTLLALRVERSAMSALLELGVDEEELSVEGVEADGTGSGLKMWKASLPPGLSLEIANLAVTKAVKSVSGRILDGREWRSGRPKRRSLTLIAGVDSIPCLEIALYETQGAESGGAPAGARLAIVVGEMGLKLGDLEVRLIESPLALTVAVLPGLPASEETARLAEANGKEVLLHLPMEPMGYPRRNPGEATLLLDQPAKEIKKRVRDYLKEIEPAAGVMNYMGSAFMRDRDLMRAALGEMNKKGVYFLDCSGSAHSVAREMAAGLDTPCIFDSGIIDARDSDPDRLRALMDRAERLALRRGTALILAKPTEALLEALLSRSGEYDSRGIGLVAASSLLEDG